VISEDRAKADRALLMDERKYFVGQNNEKLFERYETHTSRARSELDWGWAGSPMQRGLIFTLLAPAFCMACNHGCSEFSLCEH